MGRQSLGRGRRAWCLGGQAHGVLGCNFGRGCARKGGDAVASKTCGGKTKEKKQVEGSFLCSSQAWGDLTVSGVKGVLEEKGFEMLRERLT